MPRNRVAQREGDHPRGGEDVVEVRLHDPILHPDVGKRRGTPMTQSIRCRCSPDASRRQAIGEACPRTNPPPSRCPSRSSSRAPRPRCSRWSRKRPADPPTSRATPNAPPIPWSAAGSRVLERASACRPGAHARGTGGGDRQGSVGRGPEDDGRHGSPHHGSRRRAVNGRRRPRHARPPRNPSPRAIWPTAAVDAPRSPAAHPPAGGVSPDPGRDELGARSRGVVASSARRSPCSARWWPSPC